MTITFRQQFRKLEVNLGFICNHKYNIKADLKYFLNYLCLCLTSACARASVSLASLRHSVAPPLRYARKGGATLCLSEARLTEARAQALMRSCLSEART